MALTKEQWYAKIKAWFPSWFFEPEGTEEMEAAHGKGLAKILSVTQEDSEAHQAATFLSVDDNDILDAHGEERSVERLDGEANISYRERVRNLSNQSNLPALKRLVDSLLITGESIFIEAEAPDGHVFFTREDFYDRGELFWANYYNAFAILLEKQTHDPYSFFDREQFLSREDFLGSQEGVQRIYDLVTQAVNKNKAFGVLYQVVELG